MFDPNTVSPLLDNMSVGECVGRGNNGEIFALTEQETGHAYALKHISIPPSQNQVQALIYSGAVADEAGALAYYQQVVNDLVDELRSMEPLWEHPNILTYQRWQIVPRTDEIGFDVYLLADFEQPLQKTVEYGAMTHLQAVNLGVDICSALDALRSNGLLHRDLRPENLFRSANGQYMLGDLGTVRLQDLRYGSMPDNLVSDYTAPEICGTFDPLNTTIDTYSLGLVLYRIYNATHAPFEDVKTNAKAANKLRLDGEPLPVPFYADYELADIILKACAFSPSDRYETPDALKQALVLYMQRNRVSDDLIVPPIYTEPDSTLSADALEEPITPLSMTDTAALDPDFVEQLSPEVSPPGDAQAPPAECAEDAEDGAPPPETPPPESGNPPGLPVPQDLDEAEAKAADLEPESVQAEPETPPEPDQAEPEVLPVPIQAEPEVLPVPIQTEPEAPPVPPPKRRRKWIPITIASIAILGVAVYLCYLFLYAPVQITSLSVEVLGTDSLSVSVESDASPGDFVIYCEGTDGKAISRAYNGADCVFSNLTPSTQYTIRLAPLNWKILNGASPLTATTNAVTEITNLTVDGDTTSAVLNLTVSGQEPDSWVLTCKCDDTGDSSFTQGFSGHTVTVNGLSSGNTYHFSIAPGDGSELTGTTSVDYSTPTQCTLTSFAASIVSDTSVTLTWTADGGLPSTWTILMTDPTGAQQIYQTSETTYVCDNLTPGVNYSFTLQAQGLQGTVPTTVTTTTVKSVVSDLTAEAVDAGTVHLTWTDVNSSDVNWTVTYHADGTALSSVIATSDALETTIYGLIPGQSYTFQVVPSTDLSSAGVTANVQLPAAEKFNAYGVSRVFTGLFLKPTKEGWTVNDLSENRKSFNTSEGIAFAIQTLTGLESSSDTIITTYVLRDASGLPVDYYTGTKVWNDLWTRQMHVGALTRTPQTPGVYTLEVYFNNQLLTTHDFTITK